MEQREQSDPSRDETDRLRWRAALLRDISATMDSDQLLALLCEQLLLIEGVDGTIITLLDQAGEHLVVKSSKFPGDLHFLESTFREYRFSLNGQDNPHLAALRDRTTQIADAVTGTEVEKKALELWHLRQSVAWPIMAADQAVGTVMVLCRAVLPPSSHREVSELLELLGQPLEHARQFALLQQQKEAYETAAAEHERFLQFITEVNNLTLPERVYELIGHELMRRLPFDLVAVFIEREGWLECCAVLPRNDGFARQAQALLATCRQFPIAADATEGSVPMAFVHDTLLTFPDVKPIMAMDMPEKARATLNSMETPRTLLNLPIRARGKPIGVLVLSSLNEPIALDKEDLKLLESLSAFFGSAITNAQTYALAELQRREIERLNLILQDRVNELADQVATDKLTGLFNFRTFESEIERRIHECQRLLEDRALSIAMFDIDHFKGFNDSYGHAAGNVVLAGVAKIIAEQARKMDLACRYGGEEFVVILPQCDAEGALNFAERVRRAVEQARFCTGDGTKLKVTISAGVAALTGEDSQERLFERADQALYQAKRGGRNRVCAAGA